MSDEVKTNNVMCEIISTFHYFIRIKTTIIEHKICWEIDKVSNEKNADCKNACNELRWKL